MKSLPLDTLQLVFAKAVSDEDEVLLDVAMDVYTQHLIWGVSSVLDGQLECNNVEEEDLSKIFPTLASVTLCSKMHTVATSHGDRGKRALSQLLARLECVARSKDLNPGPFPFSLRNRTRKVLLKMVATLKEEWADIIFDDARLEEIHALEKKVKDHLKSTYGGPFPRQRSASRWRKGKIGLLFASNIITRYNASNLHFIIYLVLVFDVHQVYCISHPTGIRISTREMVSVAQLYGCVRWSHLNTRTKKIEVYPIIYC